MKLSDIEKNYFDKLFCFSLKTGKIIEKEPPKFLLNPSEKDFDFNIFLIELNKLQSIGIWFDKSTDGRGYSYASRIKEISPSIPIHALGKINEELSYYLKRSGFDFVHLHSQTSNKLKGTLLKSISFEILNPFKEHYQSGKNNSNGLYS